MARLSDGRLVRGDLPATPLSLLIPRRHVWRQSRTQTRRQHMDYSVSVRLINAEVGDVVAHVIAAPPVAVGEGGQQYLAHNVGAFTRAAESPQNKPAMERCLIRAAALQDQTPLLHVIVYALLPAHHITRHLEAELVVEHAPQAGSQGGHCLLVGRRDEVAPASFPVTVPVSLLPNNALPLL
eukprot:9121737-Pyramimonas_sp.AAC.1